ncbi:MAG: nucleoside 2-deoxyribosyltransferase [Candidatus Bathyarchaeia archaeon]|jgi:nucleoside 2-deoxyribosyltransferase
MKIYFAASIRGGRADMNLYRKVIRYLGTFGDVLTEHVGDSSLAVEDGLTDQQIHVRDMDWLLSCDRMVAEVTTPSLGVGYEIGRAIERGKPVLCLFRLQEGKKLSAMIAGSTDLTLCNYSKLAEAKAVIYAFFNEHSVK